MKEILHLFRNVLSPESDWPTFIRKLIGVTVAGATAVIGLHFYTQFNLSETGEQPVEVVLDNSKSKQKQIRKLIETILRLDDSIKSVWMYSWPDALNLVPIMYVGDSKNPLPASTFVRQDAPALGPFLFGECFRLTRDFNNHTCPINGFEDSWGIVVVVIDGDISASTTSEIEGLSRRVGLTLYTNRTHQSQID